MKRFLFPLVLGLGCGVAGAQSTDDVAGEATPGTLALPALTVLSSRVANQEPVATVNTPVSALRFEPWVDVQARNFAEGQADVAIRGGTFANTGFRVGGLPLYDPQTGHYTAEVPIAPGMLAVPRLMVGADLALGGGWNATAGAVEYAWRDVRVGGEVALSVGEFGSRRADLLAGTALAGGWAMEFGAAYSRADGPFANADHEIARYTLRGRRIADDAVSDVVVGYQDKFFGWPNMYTPFNSPETEDIQTLLLAATHRREAAGGWWEVGTYHRRNDDDYAFNRYAPVGPVPPFRHTTRVTAAGGRLGREVGARTSISARLWVLADEIESTSLRFGRFNSRTHLTGGLQLDHTVPLAPGRGVVQARVGMGYDETNRGADALNPVGELAWEPEGGGVWSRWALGYSTASQAPSYTALASNPAGGLFRGNADLDRSTSSTLDLTGHFEAAGWSGTVGAFVRRDDELVDWTFRRGVVARLASPLDLETSGIELFARRSWRALDLVLGYAWLHKHSDYDGAVVDGSFYALNFPEHRLTAAVVWRATDRLELRWDNEWRAQHPNPLRLNGTDQTLLSSVGVYWRTPWSRRLHLSLQVDNLWDSDFEEIPAVPAAPRQVAAGLRWRW